MLSTIVIQFFVPRDYKTRSIPLPGSRVYSVTGVFFLGVKKLILQREDPSYVAVSSFFPAVYYGTGGEKLGKHEERNSSVKNSVQIRHGWLEDAPHNRWEGLCFR